jgi:hypothetical protein
VGGEGGGYRFSERTKIRSRPSCEVGGAVIMLRVRGGIGFGMRGSASCGRGGLLH